MITLFLLSLPKSTDSVELRPVLSSTESPPSYTAGNITAAENNPGRSLQILAADSPGDHSGRSSACLRGITIPRRLFYL